MLPSTSFMGREDGHHMKKDQELASLREQVATLERANASLEHERHKAAEYAKAAYRDHRREREALYEIEQLCLRSQEKFPVLGEEPLKLVADRCRLELRDYHGS